MDASFADALSGIDMSSPDALSAELTKRFMEMKGLGYGQAPVSLEGILDANASAKSVFRLCSIAHYMGSVDSNAAAEIRLYLFIELRTNKITSNWTSANRAKILELDLDGFCELVEETWVKLEPLSSEYQELATIKKRPKESYYDFVLRYMELFTIVHGYALKLRNADTAELREIGLRTENVCAQMLLYCFPRNMRYLISDRLSFNDVIVIARKMDESNKPVFTKNTFPTHTRRRR